MPVIEKVTPPVEFAVAPVDSNELILLDSKVTGEEKLVYVCRGQDD